MKKYISFFVTALVLSLGLVSCSAETDEPAGGTAVEKMCGHWVVTADIIDEDGVIIEDPYEMGLWDLYTYNTANNETDVMWISDMSNFWDFTGKIKIDYNAKTFSCKDEYIYTDEDEEGNEYDVFMTITDGKIIENGGFNVNGKPTDSIEFKVTFTDGSYTYFIHGVRYAGF